MTQQTFILDGIRTAIGSYGGALSTIRTDDLAAIVLKELLARNTSLNPADVAEVVLGCANQAGEDNRNVARMASLLAGLPVTVPAETVNRLCASGLSAVVNASRAIGMGDGDIYLAGGVEHMTRAPYVMAKPASAFSRTPEIYDTSLGWRFVNSKMKEQFGIDSMGETAENLAAQYTLSREAQDAFALASQQKTARAMERGRLTREIIAVEVPGAKGSSIKVTQDEFPRPQTTLEALQKLKPAFKKDGGTVTAGNASGINDGACVILLASESGAKKCSGTPKARIVSSAVSGVEPRIMGIGPVEATRSALKKAQLALDKIDIIEMNEAFAAQCLACCKDLGLTADDPRINPNGGAIALGHPLGMSGARLLLTAMHELHERNARYALCTMCVGVGQGMAVIIERI